MKDIASVLRDQDGMISRTQARLLGVSRRTIDRRLTTGEWQRYAPCVYRDAAHTVTERAALIGTALWLGPNAVLAARSAAILWGLPAAAPPQIQFAATKVRTAPGLQVDVRRQFVDPREKTIRNGVQVQSKQLAAITAAVELERVKAGDGLAFLDRCLQLGVPHQAMTTALDRHPRAPGRPLARELLLITSDRSESEGERQTARLLKDSDLTGWTQNTWVRASGASYRLDFAFEDALVAVEFDGFAFHTDQKRFVSDRQRMNALASAGWTVVHVTWHDLRSRPAEIVAEIRAVLTQRREL